MAERERLVHFCSSLLCDLPSNKHFGKTALSLCSEWYVSSCWAGSPTQSQNGGAGSRVSGKYQAAFVFYGYCNTLPLTLCLKRTPFIIYSSRGSEKAMAPHSSTLARKIPWTEEPGGLQSIGSQRVRYNWATSLSLFTFMHWRRKWQPTPVLLPGESQGRGSLVGCHLWGRTEMDMTEAT